MLRTADTRPSSSSTSRARRSPGSRAHVVCIEEGALIGYEDHGKEPTHPVSRFVLALDGMDIWSVGPDQRATRITAIEQVAAIKVVPERGYNFFVYQRSSPWSSVFED